MLKLSVAVVFAGQLRHTGWAGWPNATALEFQRAVVAPLVAVGWEVHVYVAGDPQEKLGWYSWLRNASITSLTWGQ